MNILILNWRDIKNPKSGGAEILTHELGKRWVEAGHSVTLFSSEFFGCKKKEILDGVKIIRAGHPDIRHIFSSVHFLAYRYYKNKFKEKFDVVIDEVHGLPFFTPWYVKEKKVALICEVAGELWMKMFTPIFGLLGRIVEIFYLRLVYKNMPFLTISESTKRDLAYHGISEKNISVIPMGVSVPKVMKKFNKEKNPTLIFVGRISSLKGIEDALEATELIKRTYPNIQFWVIGRGPDIYINRLKQLCIEQGITKNVVFWGFVSEEKKFELLAKAHLLISPSIKEGFGLTIPEGGFVGTPSVVYNSLGLSDLVINGKTGMVCQKNSPLEMAKNAEKLLQDQNLYKSMRENSIVASKGYNWDNSAKFVLQILKNYAQR